MAPVSVDTSEWSKNDKDAWQIDKIFALSPPDISEQHNRNRSTERGFTESERDGTLEHKGSKSRLSRVIRQRFSRESRICMSDSKVKSKSAGSQEVVEPCKVLEQVLSQNEEERVLDDCRASQGSYDIDAEQITTLRVTKNRSGGIIKISPQHLSDVANRDQSSPIPVSHQSQTSRHERSSLSNISKTLNSRLSASNVPTNVEKKVWQSAIPETGEMKDENTKISLGCEEIEDSVSRSRPASPPAKPLSQTLHTLRHRTEPADLMGLPKEVNEAIYIVEVPLTPNLLPLRMPSLVARPEWSLTVPGTAAIATPTTASASNTFSVDEALAGAADSHKWLCSATEPWGVPKVGREEGEFSDFKVHLESLHSPCFELAGTKNTLGGIDGTASHDNFLNPNSARRKVSNHKVDNVQSTVGGSKSKIPIFQPSPSNSLLVSKSLVNLETLVRQELCSPSLPSLVENVGQKSSGRQKSDSGCVDAMFDNDGHFVPNDSASSVYASQSCSPLSSPSSSVMHMPNLLDRIKGVQSAKLQETTEDHNLESSRDITNNTEEHFKPLSLDLRGRYLKNVSSGNSSTASSSSLERAAADPWLLQRTETSPSSRDGRLGERNKDDPKEIMGFEKRHRQEGRLNRASSLSTNDEWVTLGKRNGYGYSFVPIESDDVTKVWSRALHDYVDDLRAVSSKNTGSIRHRYGRHSLRKRVRSNQPLKRSATFQSRSAAISSPNNINHYILDESIDKDANSTAVPKNTEGQLPAFFRRSPKSWSQFPSHSRPSRSSTTAGKADSVNARDFAQQTLGSARTNDPKSKGLSLGKKKSRSMTFGRSILKSWSRLYKSRSSDFRRFERGHRSSISIGGELEYPELEILPPTSQQLPSLPERKFSTFSLGSDGTPPSITSNDDTVQSADEVTASHNAKIWSKLYEDCIAYPRDTEEMSFLETPISKGRSNVPSGFSDSRSVRAHELKARDEVLLAVEQAWGDEKV